MDNVCFVDTETLGLDPDVNPVWEVGLILPDGTEREWHVRVSDRAIALARPKALEISGFEERYGKTRAIDDPEDVCRDLYELTDGCHLAGAVVSFDEERLRRLMWREGYTPAWHYHLIDVEALAAGYIAGYTPMDVEEARPPWDSERLSLLIGVEPDDFERHTALGDARWAKAMFEAVLGT